MSKVLLLRTCDKNLRSHGGFQWPESGPVAAPDWRNSTTCGNGLHGLLWGEGNASLLSVDPDAKWLVVEADAASVVDLNGKVKFPECEVVYCGDKEGAIAYLDAHGASDKAVAFATRLAGNSGTATAGEYGTATAGYRGTATAGNSGTATAGEYGELRIQRWDGKRYRTSIAYVGEDGILPGVAYQLNEAGLFVPVAEGLR